MASDNFVVVNFVGEKSSDGKPLVDLVPNGWLKVSTDGPMCAYPPPPYDDLNDLIKSSTQPQRSWKYYPAKVLGFAKTHVEGSSKLTKALEKLSVSSSECEEVENRCKKYKNPALAALLLNEIDDLSIHQSSQGNHDSQSRVVKSNAEIGQRTPQSRERSGSPFKPQTKNLRNQNSQSREVKNNADNGQRTPHSREGSGSSFEPQTKNLRNHDTQSTVVKSNAEIGQRTPHSREGSGSHFEPRTNNLQNGEIRETASPNDNVSPLLNRLPCGPERKYHRTGPAQLITLRDLSKTNAGKRNHSSSDSDYLPQTGKESSSRPKRRTIRSVASRKEYSNGGDNSEFSASKPFQENSDEDSEKSNLSRRRSSQTKLKSKGKERPSREGSPTPDDIDPIEYLQRMEERIDRTITHVKRSLNHEIKKLRASVDELKGTVMLVLKSAGGSVDSNLIVNFKEDLNLPFDDLETFENFNKSLKDKEQFSTLVTVLSGLYIPSGTDSNLTLTKSVTVLLERYITKNVAMKYSGQGKGRLKKLDFSSTRFYRALESAIIQIDKKKNTKQVIQAVSTVLAKSSDWDGGRNSRNDKKRAANNVDTREDVDDDSSNSSGSGSETAVVNDSLQDNTDH